MAGFNRASRRAQQSNKVRRLVYRIIAVAEACWRDHDASYSWHVLDWLCYRQRLKYPLIRECDRIIKMACTS